MKAVILAAGYATRLYPLTENTPKQLLQVGPKLMIEHIIDRIEKVDEINEIIIVTNDKFFEKFVEWEKNFQCPKKIKLINDGTRSNEERLGAIGDMHLAIKQENIDEGIIVIGGDNLFDFDLNDFMAHHRSCGHPVVAARDLGSPEALAKKFGTIEVDDKSMISSFEEKPEKPKSSLAATCIYFLRKEEVEELEKLISEDKIPDNTGDFIRHIVEKGPVACFTFSGMWYDIGSHDQLKEVHDLFNERNN